MIPPIQPNKEEPSTSGIDGKATSESQTEAEYKNPFTMTEAILQKRLLKKYKGRYITQFFAAITGIECIM